MSTYSDAQVPSSQHFKGTRVLGHLPTFTSMDEDMQPYPSPTLTEPATPDKENQVFILEEARSSEQTLADAMSGQYHRTPTVIVVFLFFSLFMLNPLSFAADDLFAGAISLIAERFRISLTAAQARSYRWDSFGFVFASLGAPSAALMASFVGPKPISVIGSAMAASGISLTLLGLRQASETLVLGGLSIRGAGAEMQIQTLFSLVKLWIDNLKLDDADQSLVYMERAVALINGVVYPAVAIGPILTLSNSWNVITYGIAVAAGLSCLSSASLFALVRNRPVVLVEKGRRSSRTLKFSATELIRICKSRVISLSTYLWQHPSAIVILIERNIVVAIQESINKALATVIIPLHYASDPETGDQLARLALILPAVCMLAGTLLYTFIVSRYLPLRQFAQRWTLFIMSGLVSATAGTWYLSSLDLGIVSLICTMCLSGLVRGLSSAVIAYPIGIAYDASSQDVDASNVMPLVSNLLQNTLCSIAARFTLSIADRVGQEDQVVVYRMLPFAAYLALAVGFVIHGGIQWKGRRDAVRTALGRQRRT